MTCFRLLMAFLHMDMVNIRLKIFSYINSIHSCIQLDCNYSKECIQTLTVSFSVDNTGIITTYMYVKPTDSLQYLLATSYHPNHFNRIIINSHVLRILRICSNNETARLRCTEFVDCLVMRGHISEGITYR